MIRAGRADAADGTDRHARDLLVVEAARVHQQGQQFALAVVQAGPYRPPNRGAALRRREGLVLRLTPGQVIEAVDQPLAIRVPSPATRLVGCRHPEPAGQVRWLPDIGGVHGESEPGLLCNILDLGARAEVTARRSEGNLPVAPDELVERIDVPRNERVDELVGPEQAVSATSVAHVAHASSLCPLLSDRRRAA